MSFPQLLAVFFILGYTAQALPLPTVPFSTTDATNLPATTSLLPVFPSTSSVPPATTSSLLSTNTARHQRGILDDIEDEAHDLKGEIADKLNLNPQGAGHIAKRESISVAQVGEEPHVHPRAGCLHPRDLEAQTTTKVKGVKKRDPQYLGTAFNEWLNCKFNHDCNSDGDLERRNLDAVGVAEERV